jgi:hypothetical protein
MHLQVCGAEEKGRNTRVLAPLASPRRFEPGRGVAWRDEVRRWARAHNVRMNSLPKSEPKPHSPAASFCCLFLLRVRV